MRLPFLLILAGGGILLAGCSKESDGKSKAPPEFHVPALGTQPKIPLATVAPATGPRKIPPSDPKKEIKTPSGLKYEDLTAGEGPGAQTGDEVTVHYSGWLTDGTPFDSSLDRGQPFSFKLGGHRVIKGWDEGVVGMKAGGRRKLIVPPNLGYGENGMPPKIPPQAELIFEVELLKIGK